MSFKERYREWIKRVVDDRCQFEYYDEEWGFVECGRPVDHVHHIVAEGWLLNEGEDPEHLNPGLPLCKWHHTGGNLYTENEEWDEDFSFHPDAGQAYEDYKAYKDERSRVLYHFGKEAASKVKSPFQEMSEGHRQKMAEGERYWAGDENIDQYYIDKMRLLIWQYIVNNPDDLEPERKPHPRYDPERKPRNKLWRLIFGE